jgi:hypothetical protein
MFSADDRIVVRWTGTGTHVGTVNRIPPTGRAVRVAAISIHRVQDELGVHMDGYRVGRTAGGTSIV